MLNAHFINVGYGDSIYLSANGEGRKFSMLIDTGGGDPRHIGESPNRIGCADYLRNIGVCHLDLLLLTHLHLDHVGGLVELAESVRVDRLATGYLPPPDSLLPGVPPACFEPGAQSLWKALDIYIRGLRILQRQGTHLVQIDAPGSEVRLAEAVNGSYIVGALELRLLQKRILDDFFVHPTQSGAGLCELDGFINNLSISLLLRCGEARVLLPGDACADYWTEMEVPQCDLLKLAHHGYTDSITPALAAQFAPRIVVVSVSDSRSDRPSVQAAAAFDAASPPPEILCTDAVEIPGYCVRHNWQAIVLECREDGTILRRSAQSRHTGRRAVECIRT